MSLQQHSINPKILLEHEMALEKEIMAIYPINHTEVFTHTIPAQTKTWRKDALFSNKKPKHIIFGMVSNEAFNGSYELNPFNFQHFNLNQISVAVDGENIPFQPFTPDFANKNCLRDYTSLYLSAGTFGKDASLPITYNDFLRGYTLYIFNLAPDLSNNATSPNDSANIRIQLQFQEQLANAVTLIVFATFHSVIQIDQFRNVFCDFKA